MPLHPQVESLLERMAALDMKPLEESTPDEARRGMRLRTLGLGKPEWVDHVRDLRVPVSGGEISVRSYAMAESSCAALVYFHGGGWVIGDIETHDGFCRSLCVATGAKVFSVDYRLAPEHLYPTAAEDCYEATRWIVENADSLGVDPTKVSVGGDSAGGNLAAVVALMARDRGGPSLRFQLLIYPIANADLETTSYHENATGFGLTREGMRWFWDHYIPDAEQRAAPYASPLGNASLGDLPPALVITAEYDVLRDEGEAYAQKLKEAGSTVSLKRYDGMIHGFVRLTAALDVARSALADMARELRAHVD